MTHYALGWVASVVVVALVGWARWRVLPWWVLVSLSLEWWLRLLPAGSWDTSALGWGHWSIRLPYLVELSLMGVYASYSLCWVAVAWSVPSWGRTQSVLLAAASVASGVIGVSPPWSSVEDLRRPLALWLSSTPDLQPSAALPSLHVLLPLLAALTARSRTWMVYTGATTLAVVLIAEHWVTDVVVSWVLGLGWAVCDERRGVRWLVRVGEVGGNGDGGVSSAEKRPVYPGDA